MFGNEEHLEVFYVPLAACTVVCFGSSLNCHIGKMNIFEVVRQVVIEALTIVGHLADIAVVSVSRKAGKCTAMQVDFQGIIGHNQSIDSQIELLSSDQVRTLNVLLYNVCFCLL